MRACVKISCFLLFAGFAAAAAPAGAESYPSKPVKLIVGVSLRRRRRHSRASLRSAAERVARPADRRRESARRLGSDRR